MHSKKIRNLITSLSFLLIIFTLAIISLATPDNKYTLSERRQLEQFPTLNIKTISNGEFTNKFEKYSLDQFPLRDNFRKLKQIYIKDIMREKTCNGFYMIDGYIGKLEYPQNDKSVQNIIKVMNGVYENSLKGTDCKIYLSIIPDKNYYLGKEHGYLSLNYVDLIEQIQKEMPYANYIDIFPTLTIDNYYKTDQHWKQETLVPTANTLINGMGKNNGENYNVIKIDKNFYGTYYGQSLLHAEHDTISYLTNNTIKNCKVTSYDTGKGKPISVYTLEDVNGKDMYDIYLGGPDALIVVENPNAKTKDELVIFRDSFGSSISPLLFEQYSKITLVDFRYISSKGINYFIDFDNQDVLFLYSTLIINNSMSFK